MGRLEHDLGDALVLLELAVGRLLGPEVGDRRGHHDDVVRRRPADHRVLHLGRGLHRDDLDAGRRGPADGGDQRDVGPPPGGHLGDGVALLARRAVGDDAHRVDRLPGAAGGDQHPHPGEVARPRREHAPRPRRRCRRDRRGVPRRRRRRRGDRTSGSTTCTPRRRSVARLSWTAGCSHISVCIAGATSTGARVASSVAVSRSSEIPAAYLPEQLGGGRAPRSRGPRPGPSRVCGMGSGASNSDVRAGSDASAENVSAPTKRRASCGEHRRDVRAGVDQPPADLDGLVGGDAAAHAEDDARPRTARQD